MELKIWVLKPTNVGDRRIGYDCYDGHVVLAESEYRARALCPAGDEGGEFWLKPTLSTCEELELNMCRTVLSSFCAG